MSLWRSFLLLSAPVLSLAHDLTPVSLQLTYPGAPGYITLRNSSNETGCTTSAAVTVSGDAVTVSPATTTYQTPPTQSTTFTVTPVKAGNATITVNWTITVPSQNCSGGGAPRTTVQVVAASPIPPETITLGPNDGVAIEQVRFAQSGQSPTLTRWGRANADFPRVSTRSGFSRGYVNIYSRSGWVVQNWLMDSSESLLTTLPAPPPNVFNFQLFDSTTAPEPVTTAPLLILLARQPLLQTSLITPPLIEYPVVPVTIAQEGGGTIARTVTFGDPPPPRSVTFTQPAGETFSVIQPNQVNVETATNQCFPMSVANSLQYLEARYSINVPHDHVMGVKGDNTLVGRLDTLADRQATSRRSGSGTPFNSMLSGKFRYLADNRLDQLLVHNHQGRGYGDTALPAGNFSASGVTSNSAGAAVTWEWMCEQIKAGEDIELVFSYDNAAGEPTGGHAVRVFGCGKTNDRPWIKFLHDSNQSDDSAGLVQETAYVADSDGDGMLNLAPTREVRFAFSESVTDAVKAGNTAPPQTTGEKLVSAASFVLGLGSGGALATAFGWFAEAAFGPNARAALAEPRAGGTTVYVNGRAAPIFYAGSTQINFQVPAETEPGPASVVIVVNGRPSELVTSVVNATAPGIFQLDPSIAGPGRGVIQNQDYSFNVPVSAGIGKPAAPGTAIIVYMTGLGRMSPPQATGEPAPADPPAEAVAEVTATIAGRDARVLFAGAAPGFAGLHQVNIVIPDGLPDGDADLIVRAGGVNSNTVTVTIGAN